MQSRHTLICRVTRMERTVNGEILLATAPAAVPGAIDRLFPTATAAIRKSNNFAPCRKY
jgi:hypothetical protein